VTARDVLTPHAARWACEQDYFYGQTRLGVEDFRMCPVGAIAKYIPVVYLALLFLRVQRLHGQHRMLVEALAAIPSDIYSSCCSP
jgi:hypothetical protein